MFKLSYEGRRGAGDHCVVKMGHSMQNRKKIRQNKDTLNISFFVTIFFIKTVQNVEVANILFNISRLAFPLFVNQQR